MRRSQTKNSKVLGSLLIMAAWLAISTASAYAQNTVTKVTLIMTDTQGNVLMTKDVHGNILARYTYRPYGTQQTGPTNAGPGYTGHVHDPVTGLVYMQQRYYNPAVGRFLRPDPIAPTPGDVFNFGRYTYANDNPIINIDPDGRQEVPEAREDPRLEEALHPKLGPNLVDASLAGPAAGESDLDYAVRKAHADAKADAAPGVKVDYAKVAKVATANYYSVHPAENGTGSYTNFHESGKTYSGKGGRARSQVSARRVEKQTGDKHIATDWSPASNGRSAFKQESRRIDANGGPKDPSNYNKIESPGTKMRQQDEVH